jgi:hypothetical protein
VEEVQLRSGKQRIRPFVEGAKVHHRGVSRALQRVVTDFAADVPFAQAMDKLVEHYGVLLSESVIRRITLGHAEKMFETAERLETWPEDPGEEWVVAQMDGGMVPIMEPDAAQSDQRKGKSLLWKEAKIALAHPQGSRTLAYGGTLQGDAQQAGRLLFDCARRAGFGSNSQLHAVGDGASWIAGPVKWTLSLAQAVDIWWISGMSATTSGPLPSSSPRPRQRPRRGWRSKKIASRAVGPRRFWMPSTRIVRPSKSRMRRPPFESAIATSVSVWISSTTTTPCARTCLSAPARSRAPIDTSCNSVSNVLAPGGGFATPSTCWPYACIGLIISGRRTGMIPFGQASRPHQFESHPTGRFPPCQYEVRHLPSCN